MKTRSSWLNCALRDDEAVYWVCMRRYQLVFDDTGSVEDIHAFIYCTKWRSGQVLPMPDWLTDWLTDSHLKDRATQLFIKYKSGALVTQVGFNCKSKSTPPPSLAFVFGGDISVSVPNDISMIMMCRRFKTQTTLSVQQKRIFHISQTIIFYLVF